MERVWAEWRLRGGDKEHEIWVKQRGNQNGWRRCSLVYFIRRARKELHRFKSSARPQRRRGGQYLPTPERKDSPNKETVGTNRKNNEIDTSMCFNTYSRSFNKTDGESVRPAVSGEPGAPRKEHLCVSLPAATDGPITQPSSSLRRKTQGSRGQRSSLARAN